MFGQLAGKFLGVSGTWKYTPFSQKVLHWTRRI